MSVLAVVAGSVVFAGPQDKVIRNPYAGVRRVSRADAAAAEQAVREAADAQRDSVGWSAVPALDSVLRIQRRLGSPPSFWHHCNSVAAYEALSASAEEQAAVASSLEDLGALEQSLTVEVEKVSAALERARVGLGPQASKDLDAQAAELVARQQAFDELAKKALRATKRRASGAFGRWSDSVAGCFEADARSLVASLRRSLEQWGANPSVPVLGVGQLSYVSGATSSAPTLPLGTAKPSYSDVGSKAGTLEDTTQGKEIELTPALVAKATQLASPAAAYDFVKNDVTLDWSYGAMKATSATLADQRGNAAELAGLLIGLLRAQGVPARYVYGTISLSAERLAALFGLLTPAEADLLDTSTGFTLDSTRRATVLAGLSAAGVPFAVVGGDVQFGHVWVEAYLPYGSYRGASVGSEGKQWVACDPAIAGRAKVAVRPPPMDVLASMGQTSQSLTDAWLLQPRGQDFRAFVQSQVEAWLTATHSSWTYAQLQASVTPRPERLNYIPGTLPYTVVSVVGEAAFLPDSLLHHVHIEVNDAAGPLLSTTVATHQVVGHRAMLTFEPAGPGDLATIMASGGLYQSPPSAVSLLSVLRVNGSDLAVATRASSLGTSHTLVTEFQLPGGQTKRIENALIAGNVVAMGLGAPRNGFVEGQFANDIDGRAEKWLYARAVAYANGWTQNEDEFAGLLGARLVRRMPNLVLVSNQLSVQESLGVRTHVNWKGVQIDADLRATAPIGVSSARTADVLRLSGTEGSALEAQVLLEGTGEDSISTTGVLQEAATQGVSVLSIDETNASTQVPLVNASSEVLAELDAAVAMHRVSLVTAVPIEVKNWTGSGLLVRNPQTSEASYFLSGQISGGATIVAPQFWLDQQLVDVLSNPGQPEVITDLTKVARIIRVPGTQLQRAPVDHLGARVVAAYVTTSDGIRIAGADVTFRADGSSRARFPLGNQCPASLDASVALPDNVTVKTDATGIAVVAVCPEAHFSWGYYESLANAVPQFLGTVAVQAETNAPSGAIRLPEPFVLVSDPGALAELVRLDPTPSFSIEQGLSALNAFAVLAHDRFGNPISNKPISWSQTGMGRFLLETANSANRIVAIDESDPLQLIMATQATDEVGLSVARYIAPRAPGPVTVVANADSVSQTYAVNSVAAKFAARASFTFSTAEGVWGALMPQPLLFQLWRYQNGAWSAVPSNTAAYYRGNFVSFNVANTNEAVPGAVDASDTAFANWGDDANTIAFWPRYHVRRGTQGFQIRLEASVPDAQEPTGFASVEESLSFSVDVSPARIALGQVFQGSPFTRLPPPSTSASAGALAAGFQVENNSQSDLFLQVDQPTQLISFALNPRAQPPSDFPGAITLAPGTSRDAFGQIVKRPGFVVASLYAKGPSGYESIPFEDVAVLGSDRPTSGNVGIKTSLSLLLLSSDTTLILGDQPIASLTFPVRSFRNQKSYTAPSGTNPAPSAPPIAVDDEPIPSPGLLIFTPTGSGDVVVSRGNPSIPVAQGRIFVVDGVLSGVANIPGQEALPSVQSTVDGKIRVALEPTSPIDEPLSISFVPGDGSASVTQASSLKTRIKDLGVMPLAQTFVKDVSVADGHLVKQFNDIAINGRGGALNFSRTYSSNGSERTPLGIGWNHSYRIFLQEMPSRVVGRLKMAVIGGSGGGQVFDCNSTQACAAQAGYHGRLSLTPQGWLFRTKGGVGYLFDSALDNQSRHRLKTMTDPAGHVTQLVYGNVGFPGEVTAVIEPGGARQLIFNYDVVNSSLRLKRVLLAGSTPLNLLGLCVDFSFNATGALETATRSDCSSTSPKKTETFHYVTTGSDEVKANLTEYIDANQNSTLYSWMSASDPVASETDFEFMLTPDAKAERIKEVREPLGVTTSFSYSLAAEPQGSSFLYRTTVTPARAELRSAGAAGVTSYFMEPYGSATKIVRPLTNGTVATSRQVFDGFHQLQREVDALGRTTEFGYDLNGNLNSKKVTTTGIVSPSGVTLASGVVDASGAPVVSTLEQWTYDNFAQWTCHIDAEGRAQGRVTDLTTGLVLEERRFATAASGSSCPTPSPSDLTIASKYIGVNFAGTVTGGMTGDLVQRFDGSGQTITSIQAFDAYGNVQKRQTTGFGGVAVTTTNVYDSHSLLRDSQDTSSHHSTTEYDELDRPRETQRLNAVPAVAPSLGTHHTFAYYPGGQLKVDTDLQTGLVRTYALDSLNRVTQVTESGGALGAALISQTTYDEHSNVVAKRDRRGVTAFTEYDFADRPTRTVVAVCPADVGQFTAQGGELSDVGQPVVPPLTLPTNCQVQSVGLISAVTYDDVGNRRSETSALGHTTNSSFDALYRAVSVTSPEVLGESLAGSLKTWTTSRRYDRTGRIRWEQDGNLNETTTTYDAFGRTQAVTDAVSRVTTRFYDTNDNATLEVTKVGVVEQHRRETTWDALNRPLHVAETAAGVTGAYISDTHYDDAAHTKATKDARGFVTLTKFDALDRAYDETRDVANANGLVRTNPTDVLLATPLGLKSSSRYDSNGNRIEFTDALGRVTVETYDGLSRLLSRTKPMGVSEYFDAYDGEGHLLASRDGRGIVRSATLDKLGRQLSWELKEDLSTAGATLETKRSVYADAVDAQRRNQRRDVDALGHVTRSWTDALGRVVRVEDPSLNGTTFAQETRYDARVKRAERDRNGFETRWTYDGIYRQVQEDDFDIANSTPTYSTTSAYDDVLRTVTQVDRSLIQTVAQADGFGRVVKTTRGLPALQQVVTHAFDELGNEVQTVDANSHISAKVFDAVGRLVRDTKGVGTGDKMETVSTFDAVGNVVATKSLRVTGVPFDVRTTYDDLNRPVRMEDASGRVTSKAYDEVGNVRCVKESLGGAPFGDNGAGGMTVAALQAAVCAGRFVTRYTYEETGKEASLTDANGATWNFLYDAQRNLVAKLDANSHLTTYGYDARNSRIVEYQHLEASASLPTRVTLPSYTAPNGDFTAGSLRTRWAYDGAGHVSDVTDAKGQLTHSAYGLLGRLSEVTYSQHVTPRAYPSVESTKFAYTGNGEVKSVEEHKLTSGGPVVETTTNGYDALERRASTLRYDSREVKYGYDLKGNRARVEDSTGEVTAYTYDAVDRLKTATTPAGVAQYSYFEDGLLKTTQYPVASNTMTEGRQYDEAGRLTQLKSTKGAVLVAEFDYEYDGNGNRSHLTETRSGGAAEDTYYGYDDANRLVGVKYPEETVLYSLDSTGNRLGEKKALPGVVAALTVAAFAALAPADASAYTVRQYNSVDWLTQKQQVLPTAQTAVLTYDSNGNRVAEGSRTYRWDIRDTLSEVSESGVVVGTYDYDAQLQRVKSDTQDGHVEYVLDGQYVLQEGGVRTRRYHFGEGNGLAVTDASGSRWLLNDAQGSTSAEVGTSTTHRKYDAWGNYRGGTTPTASDARLGYTGHQYDIETGLTYARARYYDSVNGVFLSQDSVEGSLSDAPSLHRFAYAHQNPVRYADPDGRCIDYTAADGVARFNGAMCVESGKALGGYVLGVGKFVAEGAWSLADQMSGGVLSANVRNFESSIHPKTREDVLKESAASAYANEHPIETLKNAAGAYGERLKGMVDRGDSFGLGTEAGEAAPQVVLGAEGLVSLAKGGVNLARRAAGFAKEALSAEAALDSELATNAPKTVVESPDAPEPMVCPCFEAGTLVQTKEGGRPIEEIREGELVLSRNEATGETDFRRVARRFITPDKEVFELNLEDERGVASTLSVTANHPFWVRDFGWVGAAHLASGIEVSSASGGWLRVTGATWHQRHATVFNFEVEDFHTYFVGTAGAWVHNTCSPGCERPAWGALGDEDIRVSRMSAADIDRAAMAQERAERSAVGKTATSPTAGKPVNAQTRQRILARDQNPDGSWECATCGQKTKNPDNIHTGHIKARSLGGDLSDGNLRCEGAACNLSQGNRPAPKPESTCAERGSCGAPYGRTD